MKIHALFIVPLLLMAAACSAEPTVSEKDAAFLSDLRGRGVGQNSTDGTMLELAHALCDAYGGSTSKNELRHSLFTNEKWQDPGDEAAFVDASVRTYCPDGAEPGTPQRSEAPTSDKAASLPRTTTSGVPTTTRPRLSSDPQYVRYMDAMEEAEITVRDLDV